MTDNINDCSGKKPLLHIFGFPWSFSKHQSLIIGDRFRGGGMPSCEGRDIQKHLAELVEQKSKIHVPWLPSIWEVEHPGRNSIAEMKSGISKQAQGEVTSPT